MRCDRPREPLPCEGVRPARSVAGLGVAGVLASALWTIILQPAPRRSTLSPRFSSFGWRRAGRIISVTGRSALRDAGASQPPFAEVATRSVRADSARCLGARPPFRRLGGDFVSIGVWTCVGLLVTWGATAVCLRVKATERDSRSCPGSVARRRLLLQPDLLAAWCARPVAPPQDRPGPPPPHWCAHYLRSLACTLAGVAALAETRTGERATDRR